MPLLHKTRNSYSRLEYLTKDAILKKYSMESCGLSNPQDLMPSRTHVLRLDLSLILGYKLLLSL